MSTTYTTTTINQSPTIVLPASAELKEARAKAVMVISGKAAIATAGANAIGVVMLSDDETIAADDDVNIQIKDIGAWVAGGEIAVGDELASDASGRAVKAAGSDFILGTALTAATTAGTIIRFQITKAGYKPSAGAST